MFFMIKTILIPDSQSAWGQEREVILEREGKGSFGISIVGGKVSVVHL